MKDLIDVLNAYAVSDGAVKEQCVIPEIDFTEINTNIETYRQQSIEFLRYLIWRR